ncbi:MAG TPA: mechanosensitive ion channel family protein [Bacteroidota bacterium]|nr:mechanosensitive ion channel family protein [Bacteroidota bacterium]
MITEDTIINHTIIAVLIIIGSVIVGKLAKWIIGVIFKRLAARTKTVLDDLLLEVVEARIVLLTTLAGFSIGIQEVRKGLTSANVTHHQILDYLSIALFVVLVGVIANLVSRLFRTLMVWYAEKVSAEKHSNIRPMIVPVTTKLMNILLFMIGGIIILDHFGVNIGGLLVSLGVGSLAVALAAQETLANMIAWFVILIDQPIRIGDRIRLPSGDEGDVLQITLRSTRILNPDNNLVIIPNSDIVKSRIVNLSVPDISGSYVVDFPVTIGSDVEKVRKIMTDVARQSPDAGQDSIPDVRIVEIRETAMMVRVSGKISDVRNKYAVETALREKVYTAFRAQGVEIPSAAKYIAIQNSNATQTSQAK